MSTTYSKVRTSHTLFTILFCSLHQAESWLGSNIKQHTFTTYSFTANIINHSSSSKAHKHFFHHSPKRRRTTNKDNQGSTPSNIIRLRMSNANDDFDDDFGDDSFLLNFDPDEAIAKRNKEMEVNMKMKKTTTENSTSNSYIHQNQFKNPQLTNDGIHNHLSRRPLSSQTNKASPLNHRNPYPTNTSNTFTTHIIASSGNSHQKQNPYSTNNSDIGSMTQDHANTYHNSSNQNRPFGENSKFSVGNIDTTQYRDIPTSPRKRANSNNNGFYNNSNNSNNSNINSNTYYSPSKQQGNKKQRKHTQNGVGVSLNSPISSHLSSIPKKTIHPNKNTINTKVDPEHTSKYISTLEKHFGYKSFRNGQLPIIHSIINEKTDVAVFWSTGSGKSLCYQIPPLHTNKIAIIVSPLISLMEDQVSKLNGLLNTQETTRTGMMETKDIAVYLGSGQMDQSAEYRALQGEYTFVYCTPEKLLSGGGQFLNSLAALHQKENVFGGNGDNICLFAIDESHCVSEWGHDFRPEFRSLGENIRSHSTLSSIPIIALTATAIPRVQQDIIASLRLRNPKISQQSFDRTNLVISIKRKPSSGGFRSALKPFVEDLRKKCNERGNGQIGSESTIIYCPTQGTVEEVSQWLSNAFANDNVKVQPYHGGLSTPDRTDAHINFLTGKTAIIVATIAFGMGIDKPDTRRIIHWGPPKTVEEYYQQIGRAGRDGLESYCVMYCNAGDFESYKSDFYLGKLGAEAKEMQVRSIDSLREYALSDEVCRRAELLKFFGEEPSFGERCGTCDTCQMRNLHPDDIERDFANDGARLVLYAISSLNGRQGSSTLEKVLRGNKVEGYRYRNSVDESSVGSKILQMKGEIKGFKKKLPVSYFTKDLLPALVGRGFVEIKSQTSKTAVYGRGRNVSWSGYDLTSKGWNVLDNGPIVIPVPASVREVEQKQQEELQESLTKLEKAGVDLDQIPKSELEEGDGEVLKSLRTWHNYLDNLQRNQRSERVDQLDDLRQRLEAWRSDMAVKFRMAPASIMQEHLLLKVAYTAASLKRGHLEREALLAVGVRSGGIDDLQAVITDWLEETLESRNPDNNVTNQIGGGNKMIIPDTIFKPSKAWEHFEYKPNKNTGLASWESSFNRFSQGEHPQAIAMSPANGRPIQVQTVVGHVFDGLVSGRPVNLKRISNLMTFPDQQEWNILTSTEQKTGMNVVGNPKSSGKDGDTFKMLDFLTPVLGEEFAAKSYDERTQEEKALYSKWCQILKCYITFRRIGYIPSFEGNEEQESDDGTCIEV